MCNKYLYLLTASLVNINLKNIYDNNLLLITY